MRGFSILFCLLIFSSPAFAQAEAPVWFKADIARKAAWLPRSIKTQGLQSAFEQNWNAIPFDIQMILVEKAIPEWQIALIQLTPLNSEEIFKQLRFMSQLAGAKARSPIAQRAEQLLIFGGAAQLPTPGDNRNGRSLGPEGCTSAMAKYVIAQLKLEFANELSGLPEQLARTQSSVEMKSLFEATARRLPNLIRIVRKPFETLTENDITPGSFMIAQKPGGTHTFGWTRVPQGWNWSAEDKMAIGNTGLPQFGDRMILAQEYITNDANQSLHNEHGPINSASLVVRRGQVDLTDPRTNVYAAQGSQFIIINFR